MQMYGDFSPPSKQLSQRWPAFETACSKHKYQDRRACVLILHKFMLSAVAETGGAELGGGVCLSSFHDFLSTLRSLVVPPLERRRRRSLSSSVSLPPPSSAASRCDPGPSAPDSFCFPHLPREPASEEVRGVGGVKRSCWREKRGSRRRLRAAAAGKRREFESSSHRPEQRGGWGR